MTVRQEYWAWALMLNLVVLTAYFERFDSDVGAVGQTIPMWLQIVAAVLGLLYLVFVGYLTLSVGTCGRLYRETVPTICIGLTTIRLALIVVTFVVASLVEYGQTGQVMILSVGLAYFALSTVDYCLYIAQD